MNKLGISQINNEIFKSQTSLNNEHILETITYQYLETRLVLKLNMNTYLSTTLTLPFFTLINTISSVNLN